MFGLLNDNAVTHKLYKCSSTDTKPTAHIEGGAYCFETDTTILYVFDGEAWVLGSTYGVTESGATGYDVTDYGATGDGTKDDKAAIEAAMAAAIANLPATVYFPPGDYAISAGTEYTLPQGSGGLSIVGAGPNIAKITFDKGSALGNGEYKAFKFSPTTTVEQGANTGTSATIMTDTDGGFTVDALIGDYIHNITDGSAGEITDNDATTITVASLTGGTANTWVAADEYIVSDSATDPYSLYLHDIHIEGIGFFDNDPSTHGSAGEESHGIQIRETVNASVKHCDFTDIGDEGIDFINVIRGDISYNTSQNTPALGATGSTLSVGSGSRGVTVSNNRINAGPAKGTRSTVSGATGIATGVAGLPQTLSMQDISIVNNTISDCIYGISIGTSDDTNNSNLYDFIVSSNTINNCEVGIRRTGGQGVAYGCNFSSNTITDTDSGIVAETAANQNLGAIYSNNNLRNILTVGMTVGGTNMSLTGNNVMDCTGTAIKMTNSSGVSISGGVLENCGGTALPDITCFSDGYDVLVTGVKIINSQATSQVIRYCNDVRDCVIEQAAPNVAQIGNALNVIGNTINGGIRTTGDYGSISNNVITTTGDIVGDAIEMSSSKNSYVISNNVINTDYSPGAGTFRKGIDILASSDNHIIIGNQVKTNTPGSGITNAGTGNTLANNHDL